MQVKKIVVSRIKVNVMYDLAGFSASKFSMLPLAAAPFAAIAETMRLDKGGVRPVCLFGGWINGWRRFGDFCDGRHHLVSTPFVFAARKALNLLGIYIKRVSMAMPHLIMASAHFSCGNGAITVFASAANYLSAPAIFRGSVLLNALIVHKAKTICGMLAAATINAARLILKRGSHCIPISLSFPKFYHDKALGNSMAVPVMAHIGRRIQLVENLINQEAA